MDSQHNLVAFRNLEHLFADHTPRQCLTDILDNLAPIDAHNATAGGVNVLLASTLVNRVRPQVHVLQR